MNCEKISKATAQAFYDDALNAQEKAQMQNHLLLCGWCRLEVEQWRALSGILQQDIMPLPSSSLDNKVFDAYRRKHTANNKLTAWWHKLLVNPISIPKQAFAAALIILTVFGVKYLITGNQSINLVEKATSSEIIAVSATPRSDATLGAKIIETPAKQVTTKEVYFMRENSIIAKKVKKRLLARHGGLNQKTRKPATDIDDLNFPLSGSIAQNGYFTSVNLKEFQPTEMKVRIIREVRTDEK